MQMAEFEVAAPAAVSRKAPICCGRAGSAVDTAPHGVAGDSETELGKVRGPGELGSQRAPATQLGAAEQSARQLLKHTGGKTNFASIL